MSSRIPEPQLLIYRIYTITTTRKKCLIQDRLDDADNLFIRLTGKRK